jgi:chemotaxis protein MotB
MKLKQLLILASSAALLASCGPSKKLQDCEYKYNRLDSSYRALQRWYNLSHDSLVYYDAKIKAMQDQVVTQKVNNDMVVSQLRDLSVISTSQAESIKKSLENINGKDAYIKDLQSAMARKDSLTMNLVMNLKGAIGNLDDKDVDIKIDKDVVYIDISDKILFKSGSYEVTEGAKDVLGKVAKVLLNKPDIEFLVEGHTDNRPFRQGALMDNWDLSVKRATSIIRILQDQYHIPSSRMSASGRGEYVPVTTNDTEEGRAANRRTRIVILPQLDQFFKLLEKPDKQ